MRPMRCSCVAACANFLGGWSSDRLAKKIPLRWARRGPAILGLLLAAVCGLSYAGAAHLADHRLPFSTFDMYGHAALDSASRIVARLPDGTLREVTSIDGWVCPAAARAQVASCRMRGPFATVEGEDARVLHHVFAVDGGGGAPVDLVRQIWWFDTAVPETDTCVIASCEGRVR